MPSVTLAKCKKRDERRRRASEHTRGGWTGQVEGRGGGGLPEEGEEGERRAGINNRRWGKDKGLRAPKCDTGAQEKKRKEKNMKQRN